MERTTGDELVKRLAYLEKECRSREIRSAKYSLRATIGSFQARARWNHYSGPDHTLVVDYDDLLDVAVPELVRLRCEHLGIEVPTDIAGITNMIMEHLHTVGNFVHKLDTSFAGRGAEEYARWWYTSHPYERTYGALVERGACAALISGAPPPTVFTHIKYE